MEQGGAKVGENGAYKRQRGPKGGQKVAQGRALEGVGGQTMVESDKHWLSRTKVRAPAECAELVELEFDKN